MSIDLIRECLRDNEDSNAKPVFNQEIKPTTTKLKTYIHHQSVNVLLRKENSKVSAENVDLKKHNRDLSDELDDTKAQIDEMKLAAQSSTFYLRAIETVSAVNEQLTRQIEQQRDSHKRSTAELRTGFKEMTTKSSALTTKFSMIAKFLINMSPECSVCLNQYDEHQPPVMINCVHILCKKCAFSWLEKTKTLAASCPTCRTSYRKEHINILH